MTDSLFLRIEFFLLVTSSCLFPAGIYAFLYKIKAISRLSVLLLAITMIALSGLDVILLQHLAELAKSTPSLLDDSVRERYPCYAKTRLGETEITQADQLVSGNTFRNFDIGLSTSRSA
jgi:hypothetical protein